MMGAFNAIAVALPYIEISEEIMKKIFASVLALTLALVTLSSFMTFSASAASFSDKNRYAPDDYDYSLVFVPDTQILTSFDAETPLPSSGATPDNRKGHDYVSNLYRWIVENKNSKKISHVFGLGDITQNDYWLSGYFDENFDMASAIDTEWEVAMDAIHQLDEAEIPYSQIRGNHDNLDSFNKAFNNDYYNSQFEYIDPNNRSNTYKTMNICGVDYLFITLDYRPSAEALAEAGEAIEHYSKHRVIVTTHEYLTNDEKNYYYGVGQDLWDNFVSKYPNMFMVVCGHIGYPQIMARQKQGDYGNRIHEILIDAQDVDATDPLGMVAVLYFDEDDSMVWVEYYSTVKGKYQELPVYNNTYGNFKIQPLKTTAPRVTKQPILKTTAEETTTTSADISTTAETTVSTQSGCGSMMFFGGAFMALPIVASGSAIELRKKKKER